MNLKDISDEDKPREKLMKKGVKHLTTSELISTILSRGTKGNNITQISQKLVKLNQKKSISDLSIQELTKIKGIGNSKACQLIASIELGKRISLRPNSPKTTINTPKKAFKELRLDFEPDQESLIAIFLDSRSKLILKKTLFIGTINKQIVGSREIVKKAIALNATGVILAHNHPSGNLTPSSADIKTTNKINQCLSLFDLELKDHLIITQDNYFSMKENFLI